MKLGENRGIYREGMKKQVYCTAGEKKNSAGQAGGNDFKDMNQSPLLGWFMEKNDVLN